MVLKKLAAVALVAVFSTQIMASEDNPRTGDIRDIEKFFYNQGVKESYNEAYAAGYAKAVKDALMALKRYEKLIQAREAGKYLSSENKLSSPEVYSIKTANGLQVKVRGCKIEKELTPADILRAPIANAKMFSEGDVDIYNETQGQNASDGSLAATNSVVINKRDTIQSEIPILPGNETHRAKRVYNNTPTIRKALDANNIVYSVSDKKIRAVFSSNSSAENFEKAFKLN